VFRRRRKGVDQPGTDEPGADELGTDEFGDDEFGDQDDQPDRDYVDAQADASDRGRADGRVGGRVDLGDPETWTRAQRSPAAAAAPGREQESGPWDGAADFPEGERVDFGSLLVPAREGFDIQVNMAEEQGVWIAVVRGDSGLQLQAFAAPKTSGLWDEDRKEIAAEIVKAGGETQEAEGPYGTELRARLNPAAEGQRRQPLQPVRFLGVDGPRWFLRGVISGPAARRADLAEPFEEIFADVVVVRGDHPAPPRDLLEIQLPEQAREALEAQLAQDGAGGLPNPFERGPEITETR